MYPWESKETMVIILFVQISIAPQLEDYDFEICFFRILFPDKTRFLRTCFSQISYFRDFLGTTNIFCMKILQCKV